MGSALGIRPVTSELAELLEPSRVSDGVTDRMAYSRDMWPRQQIITRSGVPAPAPPAVVTWPESTSEVASLVRYASERRIPVVPFGAGSGVCGGIQPAPMSIVVDLKRMRRVTRIDDRRLECEAEAGIIGQHLEERLAERSLTLGHFPSSISCSTLGGWLATRSAGQCSGRYGKIEDMVLGLECVDGRGDVWVTDPGNPDTTLLPLMLGSEGALALITRATLRISPAPAQRRFASYFFPSVHAGLDAIRRMYQAGLRPAVARLYDPFDSLLARQGKARRARRRPSGASGVGSRLAIRALRHPAVLNRLVHGVGLGGALLVLVWEDDVSIAEAERLEAHRIARDGSARDAGEGPARRWLAHRYAVSYRQSPLYAQGAFVDTMEVAASWSRILHVYDAVHQALARHVFVMAHVSHAYPDGASIYFTFVGSTKGDDAALEIYDRTWEEALTAVENAGGVLSHHHGVGRAKARALAREQGAALDVIRALKRKLDPNRILNPGVLIPDIEPERGHAT